MRFRRLGRTGLNLSELTIGTAGLARVAPEQARAAITLALDRGVNAVEIEAGCKDTATLLGGLLRNRTDVHVLARATSLIRFDLPSPHVPVQQAYPGHHIRAETEALLRTLGVERLGVQQLHAWCPEWLREGDWLETLQRLRDEGKIAGFGISLFDHDVDAALEAVASGAVDTVQVMYNVFDQGAASDLLPLCLRQDVGVIARSALYYGALISSPSRLSEFPPGDWRQDYFFDEHRRETDQRVSRLVGDVGSPDRSISDLALRFCLSHPAVSTAAVGMRSPAHVDANLRAAAADHLDKDELASLARHAWLC
ncbi:aldo/keto reductase [Sphingomonas cannabina]|uniref:aldo/keto reductase n=1 Tax=Sphingomonas cannabina TaxID=2899123 RepID=UPI001F2064EB|nr:aldo/keto reductase [Sphingomonas cannabina]UIJ45033.1 aldo/keto reductase [Sphingomonas cannabina]